MSIDVFVTGGTGFFGRAMLRNQNIVKNNIFYYILTRNPLKFRASFPHLATQNNVTLIHGDIEIRESLPWGYNFSHIMHLATDSTYGPSLTPIHRLDQITNGTRNVLDFAVASSAKRFLLASSGGVYGNQGSRTLKINEDSLIAPNTLSSETAYSQGKRFAEHLCTLYGEQYNIDMIIARCFSFVGPDLPMNAHFAIGNFIFDAFRRDTIMIRGDGSPIRSYLDQRDLATWLLKLLFYGSSGQAYNVGSDIPISIQELAYLVRDILAPDKKVEVLGSTKRSIMRHRYVPDITKISKELHLKPQYSLSESIYYASRMLTNE